MDFVHSGGSEIDYMNKNESKPLLGSALVAAGSLAGVASAQTAAIDVSSVTASISAAATAGATIGLAVLVMYFGLKLYKWVKTAG